MTELRDARLRKALDAAPDAQLQPQARTREAIRAAAHGAVRPAWRRWWPRAAGGGTPWAAALATVALATLVVAMWEGQEVPGARPEPAGVDRAADAAPPVPVPPQAPAPAVEAAPQPVPPPPAVARPEPVPAPAPAPQRARPRPAAQDRVASGSPPTVPAAAPPPAAAPAAPPPPPAVAPAEPAPATATAPLRDAVREAAPAADTLARSSRTPQEARASAAAAPPPPAAAAPQAPAALRAASQLAVHWTQVRIEAHGKSVVVPVEQAGRLPALVARVLASEREPVDGTPAALRLELARGNEPAGLLELVGERWRWTPLSHAEQARMLRVDPALAAALRQEAESLLR